MNKELKIIIVFLVILTGLLAKIAFDTPPVSETPRYEYRIEFIPDHLCTSTMQKIGFERWELISARRAHAADDEKYGTECIFKRAWHGSEREAKSKTLDREIEALGKDLGLAKDEDLP